jgi:pullulanase
MMKIYPEIILMALLALLLYGGCQRSKKKLKTQKPDSTAILLTQGSEYAAHWLNQELLAWKVEEGSRYELRYFHNKTVDLSTQKSREIIGGIAIPLTPLTTPMPEELKERYPHLTTFKLLSINASADEIALIVKSQIYLIAYDKSETPVRASLVQTAGVLDDLYTYNGPLGVTIDQNTPTFNLWSPTAQKIDLVVYDHEKEKVTELPMEEKASGVWQVAGEKSWAKERLFYRYRITTYHYQSRKVEIYEVTDPYSISLSTNSEYSQIVNLDDQDLKPAGWDELDSLKKQNRVPFSDINVYEVHIRDFSSVDPSVKDEHRGKYLAFTDESSLPVKHLKQLKKAGLSHIQVLPAFDFATVNDLTEERVELSDTMEDLCARKPVPYAYCLEYGTQTIREVYTDLLTKGEDGLESIATINSYLRDIDGFNWGYDPWHYSTPEGSYATNPDGVTRILEFRKMVAALTNMGFNFVMDVVYNHTYGAGNKYKTSVLDRVVPGYYHRLNPLSGAIENSSCCNNTASEHNMMEKLMVDSLKLWVKHYKVDGFRFDLMGHHMKRNMEKIKEELGESIYLYGEAWNFGEVQDGNRGENAHMDNMYDSGIGSFNDRIRDKIRGGGPFDSGESLRTQGFTTGLIEDKNSAAMLLEHKDALRSAMAGSLRDYTFISRYDKRESASNFGGYVASPMESINYICKHDNQTLWDNNQYRLGDDVNMDTRVRVHNLAVALNMLSQGVGFYHMGVDLMRSKSMQRDSYDSGDWFNGVDFSMNTHNWRIGMPRADKDGHNWEIIKHIFANEQIKPERSHMVRTAKFFRTMLAVRMSTPLLRLPTKADITNRVKFHNTGSKQDSALIVMSITDGKCVGNDLDPNLDGLVVIVNGSALEQSYKLKAAEKLPLQLEPMLEGLEDLDGASFDKGTFTIPPHAAGLFILPQSGDQGDGFECNI